MRRVLEPRVTQRQAQVRLRVAIREAELQVIRELRHDEVTGEREAHAARPELAARGRVVVRGVGEGAAELDAALHREAVAVVLGSEDEPLADDVAHAHRRPGLVVNGARDAPSSAGCRTPTRAALHTRPREAPACAAR